jgi:hypothetical protein
LVVAAVNVAALPWHTVLLLVVIVIVGTRAGVTLIVTLLEVAVEGDAQAALDVSTQLTTSLLLKDVDAKLDELVPALVPFTFHWYDGLAPPLVTAAVNVTSVPEQILLLPALIETVGAELVPTFIVTLFEIAESGTAHDELDVTTQLTTSLLLSADEE